MLLANNAPLVVRKYAQLPRTIALHAPPRAVRQVLLIVQLLTAVAAIAVDKSDGGSSALQFEQPAQPLLDHTQPHFLANRSVIVQLFEWKFADIATECEQFLGPRGFAGVQVSPVAEHLVVLSATVQHPWWERYQPLSFQIASRSGSAEEFQLMSQACNAAGVRVYVDVILNHMAGAYDEDTASGRRLLEGYAGSTANASSYDFTAIPFTSRHFHKPCELTDYFDAHVVRNCELNGWPDLNHYRLDVRANLTKFLNGLVDMGVAGFRIDAAKYIWPIDIKLLFKDIQNLNSEEFDFPADARPYVYQDVVDLGVDSISKTEYSSYGMVTEYLYAAELAHIIDGKAPLSTLINWGPAMGFLPHRQALVFVDSHDGQRDHKLLGANQLLSYRQPRKHIMATAFMLAHPYGRVKRIMSSYYFAAEQPEQGPPMEEGEDPTEGEEQVEDEAVVDADAATEKEETEAEVNVATQAHIRTPTFDASTGRCEFASGWVCEHRWPPIVQMLELVNTLDELEDGVFNFQTDGLNHIAFCRGNKAFFAFNNDPQLVYDAEVATCLPSGVYCDVISGGRAEANAGCVGKRIVVDAEGKARIMLPAALGADDVEAAAGNDYTETDVETNDAYGIAVGAEGEFGVLAIYEGSRLENGEQPEKQAAESSQGSTGDEVKEITATEEANEEDAADAEDVEDATVIADTPNEDVSPEGLEDAAVEKNAKLEEGATDASVENTDEGGNGEAADGEGDEEVDGGDADEGKSKDEVAAEEQAEDGDAPVEEKEQPAVGDEESQIDQTADEEGEEIEKVEPGDEVVETANAEESDTQADETIADAPATAEDPPTAEETSDADETEKSKEEEGLLDEAKEVLEKIEKEVTDVVHKVEDEIAQHLGKAETAMTTGIKGEAEAVSNKTKEIIAKAGFNTNRARTLQSIQLCSVSLLISSILINIYST